MSIEKMKELTTQEQELLDQYIVIKFEEESDFPFKITNRSNFEQVNACETYDRFGQTAGCEVGCYAIYNDYSEAKKDCLREMYEHFNVEYCEDDLSNYSIDETLGGENEILENISEDDIKKFVEEWKENNENHIECKAWNYWDGSNYKSIVIETYEGQYTECEEADKEISLSILKEYPGQFYIERAVGTEETDNYIFMESRYADNPWLAEVESK